MLAGLVLCIAIALIAYAFYKWAKQNEDYFVSRGIKFIKPTFLIGDITTLFLKKITAVEFANKVYNEFPEEW